LHLWKGNLPDPCQVVEVKVEKGLKEEDCTTAIGEDVKEFHRDGAGVDKYPVNQLPFHGPRKGLATWSAVRQNARGFPVVLKVVPEEAFTKLHAEEGEQLRGFLRGLHECRQTDRGCEADGYAKNSRQLRTCNCRIYFRSIVQLQP